MSKTMTISGGEFHWLKRRRALRTIEGWSTLTGFTPTEIRERELDREDVRLTEDELKELRSMTLWIGEYCALARRRSGMTMEDVAQRTKVSRMTVWKQEHGTTSSAFDLARWWKRRRFPEAPAVDRYAVRLPEGI